MFGIYPIIPQYFGIMGISAFKLMCLGIVLFACIFLGISRTLVTSCWHIQIAFGIWLIIMFINTDHTAGYPDLIFTPWVLERSVPLKVFGPKGMQHMTDHILKAYETDIDFRINGFEKANESGYRVEVTEIESGIIYKDDRVTVEAFPVSHGTLECYGYKFITPDKTIVITGDTAPLDIVAEKAKDCDILLHEVEYAAGISCREPKWQKYHREVHTLSTDLAQVAKKANPKLLVTYHRIYHMNVQDNRKNLAAEMAWRDEAILDEIREAGYEGYVVNGKDLDIF